MAESSLYRDRNLQIVFGVLLTAVMGVSSITPAFPGIMRDLQVTSGQVGLLITFFSLPGVFLPPFLGILADRLGRKRILVPAVFLFAIAGTACAFARDFNVLLALRFLQGLGGAGLGAISMTIISDLYSGKRRTEAIGLMASVISIGIASYPIIGGALALLGWYYPFALPILAVPVGILVLTMLKNPEPRNPQGLRDYLGGTWGYLKNVKVVSLFGIGVIRFAIYYGAYLAYFTLLLADSFGASSLVIGLIMSSMSITTAIVASQVGRINRRFSLGTIIRLGFLVYALAFFLIPLMPRLWLLLIPAIIFGIGHGTSGPSILTSIAELAPLEYRAAFMSLNSTVLRLGQTIGPPLMGLVYVYRGSDATFWVAAVLALLVPIVITVLGSRTKL